MDRTRVRARHVESDIATNHRNGTSRWHRGSLRSASVALKPNNVVGVNVELSSRSGQNLARGSEQGGPMPVRSDIRKPAVLRLSEGDLVIANTHAPAEYRGRRGLISEVTVGGTEFRVEFDDGVRPTTGYLKAEWLRLSSS